MAKSYTYRLPWPPSVNCYIRRGNNRSYMTKRGKEFRSEVMDIVADADAIRECTLNPFARLGVHIELTLPDRRKRDIDNHIKPVLDALQAAETFADDSQVDDLRITRLHIEAPGACDVTIVELTPANP